MNRYDCPPSAMAFLTAAVLMALFVAGGLPAALAYAVAVETLIRFLTPEPQHEPVPVRTDDRRDQ
jgi:hypothetical protein